MLHISYRYCEAHNFVRYTHFGVFIGVNRFTQQVIIWMIKPDIILYFYRYVQVDGLAHCIVKDTNVPPGYPVKRCWGQMNIISSYWRDRVRLQGLTHMSNIRLLPVRNVLDLPRCRFSLIPGLFLLTVPLHGIDIGILGNRHMCKTLPVSSYRMGFNKRFNHKSSLLRTETSTHHYGSYAIGTN